MHDALSGLGLPTFDETKADVFYVFCEAWLDPAGVAYDFDDEGLRVHSNPPGRPDQRDYDAFIEAGLFEDTVAAHDHAFLVTFPLHQMMEVYGMERERAGYLGFESLTWSGLVDYPELRDRWLITAIAWAESGRHGFTMEDACSVAKGFRDVNLDGEYGQPASCATDVPDLVCTERHCPVCGVQGPVEEVEPVMPDPVCSEESLRGPTCTTADNRQTCLDSLAISGEDCPAGQAKHCWCVANDAGEAVWDCIPELQCRPIAAAIAEASYCPEGAEAQDDEAGR